MVPTAYCNTRGRQLCKYSMHMQILVRATWEEPEEERGLPAAQVGFQPEKQLVMKGFIKEQSRAWI